MALNEKIRTPDVVEILDVKIKTSSNHPDIGVVAGETYDSVAAKLEAQVFSPEQMAAFDNTLTVPSASNPVVLKDDLPTYYPLEDLGEVKDSVNNFVDLPPVGNTTGDVRAVLSENTLYRWDGAVWQPFLSTGTLDHTQLINQDGDADYQHLTLAQIDSLDHSHANLAVLAAITNAGSGQIITSTERSRIPTTDEKDALQGTQGTPSLTNRYVTNADPRLNTLRNPYATVGNDAFATFPGTEVGAFYDAIKGISKFSCTISVASPAVVTTDHIYSDGDIIFFSTDGTLPTGLSPDIFYYVRNSTPTQFNVSEAPAGPLVDTTVAGTGNHFVGGNNHHIKALEVLPQTFVMYGLGNFGNLQWSLQDDALLLECLTPFGATLDWNTLTHAIEILPPGTGPVIIRGFRFTLGGIDTHGINISRDYCVVEDCEFVGLNSLLENHRAIDVNADYATIRRCKFSGHLVAAIGVDGDNCRIEECQFSFSSGASFAVTVLPGVNNAKIDGCHFDVCTLNTSGTYAQIVDCTMTNATTFTDTGSGTRFLQAPTATPDFFGQPYIGTKRTVGPVGSYADYRSSDAVAFSNVFGDPLVEEIEVLPGTYTFSSTLTIPVGFKIRGSHRGGVIFTAPVGTAVFQMSDGASLENVTVNSSNAPAVRVVSVDDVTVSRCVFNLVGPDTSDDFGVYSTGSSRLLVEDCNFIGIRGVSLTGNSETSIVRNKFSTSGTTFDCSTTTDSKIIGNIFVSGSVSIAGSQLVVAGNHFLAAVPSKTSAADSIWRHNYPHPEANNYLGVDTFTIFLDRYLESTTAGCQRAAILDRGVLAFLKTATASAHTLPIQLQAILDTSYAFTVRLRWTAHATSGDVRWRIGVTFRDADASEIGTTQILTITSSRTNLALFEEELAVASFPAVYGLATNATHVAVEITRLPFDLLDTMPTEAFLLQAEIELREV